MTAPPLLKLSADALDRPHRLDLATVEAMMLWPENEAKREQWWTAAHLEEGRNHLNELPAELLRHYARHALDAPRLAELRPETLDRIKHGMLAGAIVLAATGYARHDRTGAPLGKVQEDLCAHLKGFDIQIRPQTLNNHIRPLFRPVAHLWAAHLLERIWGGTAFPCSVSGLSAFLATAEDIRALAERTRVKKSPATVMRAGEAARLPDDVAAMLPAVRINFAGKVFPAEGA